ncbi:hypothetical protein AOC36_09685 [Erysipelothrix larvae]|uniref:Uncharacterized protein n=1 Tax=Erysipelothrix larvae TaxID=1514105 RepID=A0A0X8H1Q8_9FIRM|nr:hypothetical protein AOC36_09685 [Erysipelothrix larvae]
MKYEAQEHVSVLDGQGNPYLIIEGEIVILKFEALHRAYIEFNGKSYRLDQQSFRDSFIKVPRRIGNEI